MLANKYIKYNLTQIPLLSMSENLFTALPWPVKLESRSMNVHSTSPSRELHQVNDF